MQLAAHIVGGAHLSTSRVAERERVFARGAEAPIACRIGHVELEIHCRPAVSASVRRISHVWGAGGEAAREAGAMQVAAASRTCIV